MLRTTTLFLIATLLLFGGCSLRESNVSREPLAVVQTLAGAGETRFGEVFGVAINSDGSVFVSDGARSGIWQINQTTGAAHLVTDKLGTPSAIAIDQNGALIVADSGAHTIKRINPASGEISFIAGVENKSGFADGAADAALFHAPIGVAVDKENRIYVADTYNDKIRIIENGTVKTLAGTTRGFADGASAKFDTPCGIAVEKGGDIWVADTGNRRIRKIDQSGNVTTFAGSGEREAKNDFAQNASFVEPVGVAVDDFGAIWVADAGANRIRVFGRRFTGFWETASGAARGTVDGELNRALFNRPTNVAIANNGNLFVADSANKLLRVAASANQKIGVAISPETAKSLFLTPEQMREGGEPRWTYNPPDAPRDIAGTFGEVRGVLKEPDDRVWFHNGLDVAGAFGETARFVRSEKVLLPLAAEDFAAKNNRERLRMPTLGYIHIRVGRDRDNRPFDDNRFLFSRDDAGNLNGLRVPRGAHFSAGEAIGTLNAFNHVHLIAGETGAEMNALAALQFPGVRDTVVPKIEQIILYDENWREIKSGENLPPKVRVVARAFDQMDGNNARRRLGVYELGYQVLTLNNSSVAGFENPKMNVSFERLPASEQANLVYAPGSQSGYTPETFFNYIVSNVVQNGSAREDYLDTTKLSNGDYKIRVFARDFFGNQSAQDAAVKISN